MLGAIPITRLGRNRPTAGLLRLLVGVRTAALAGMAALAAYGVPFAWMVVVAAAAGSVNGAAFGDLRSLLNALTPPDHLPRGPGISATLNEVTFVLAPVVASGLGMISPVFAVLALAALPALVCPTSGQRTFPTLHKPRDRS